MKSKGRPKSTGRYDTKEELVQNVHYYWHETKQNQAQVARTTGVSETTVANFKS